MMLESRVDFLAANLEAEQGEDADVASPRRKGEKAATGGTRAKANEWCSDFLIDPFMSLKGRKKNGSIFGEPSRLTTRELLRLQFPSGNFTNQSRALMIYVANCAYIRHVIRRNIGVKHIYNFNQHCAAYT